MSDFTNEPWYLAQRVQWDQLKANGWTFSVPADPLPGGTLFGVRISMSRDGYCATLQIPNLSDPRKVHTRMLRMAQAVANSVAGPLI